MVLKQALCYVRELANRLMFVAQAQELNPINPKERWRYYQQKS